MKEGTGLAARMRALGIALLLLAVPLAGCLVGPSSSSPLTAQAMMLELDAEDRRLPLRGVFAVERSENVVEGFQPAPMSNQLVHHLQTDEEVGDGQAYAWTFLRRTDDAYSLHTVTTSGWSGSTGAGVSRSVIEPFLMGIDAGAPVDDGWMDSDAAVAAARSADPEWGDRLSTPGDLVMVLHQFSDLDFPVWAFAFHADADEGPHVVAIDARDGTRVDWSALYLGTAFASERRDVIVGTVQDTEVTLPVYSGAARAVLRVTANATPPLSDVRMELFDPAGDQMGAYVSWPEDFPFETDRPMSGDWRLVLQGSGLPGPQAPSVVVHWCVDGRTPDPLGVTDGMEPNCDDNATSA